MENIEDKINNVVNNSPVLPSINVININPTVQVLDDNSKENNDITPPSTPPSQKVPIMLLKTESNMSTFMSIEGDLNTPSSSRCNSDMSSYQPNSNDDITITSATSTVIKTVGFEPLHKDGEVQPPPLIKNRSTLISSASSIPIPKPENTSPILSSIPIKLHTSANSLPLINNSNSNNNSQPINNNNNNSNNDKPIKYFPLTPYLTKLDQIKLVSEAIGPDNELSPQTTQEKQQALESMLIEKNNDSTNDTKSTASLDYDSMSRLNLSTDSMDDDIIDVEKLIDKMTPSSSPLPIIQPPTPNTTPTGSPIKSIDFSNIDNKKELEESVTISDDDRESDFEDKESIVSFLTNLEIESTSTSTVKTNRSDSSDNIKDPSLSIATLVKKSSTYLSPLDNNPAGLSPIKKDKNKKYKREKEKEKKQIEITNNNNNNNIKNNEKTSNPSNNNNDINQLDYLLKESFNDHRSSLQFWKEIFKKKKRVNKIERDNERIQKVREDSEKLQNNQKKGNKGKANKRVNPVPTDTKYSHIYNNNLFENEVFNASKLPTESEDDGHVFILYGSLKTLVCDVKMVPCSNHISSSISNNPWLKHDWAQFPPEYRNKIQYSTSPVDFKRGRDRVYKVEGWPTQYPNISQPWFCNVVPSFRPYPVKAEWYIQGGQEFLDRVGVDLQTNKPPIKNGRSKYLVSLPILGTGGGGGSYIAGEILGLLIKELYSATRRWKYDVVLVTNEISMYTAAINARNEMMEMDKTYSYIYNNLLGPNLLSKARDLARLIDQGKLTVFVGAGASRSAGLPTWGGLLQMLGEKLGMTQDEVKQMEQLHYLDRASVLEGRWKKALAKYSPPTPNVQIDKLFSIRASEENDGPIRISNDLSESDGFGIFHEIHQKIYNEINVPMQTEIANLMRVSHAGLPHFLLASTQIQEFITTNYDECIEIASKSLDKEICVLPYETSNHSKKRWILKLHGCVSNPKDIVITREDYVRYGDKKEALSGIVQSSLITKHLLFVGFSLVDDNFFQIMSAVKKVTQNNKKTKHGTVLFIQKNDLMDDLWGDYLNIVNFDQTGNGDIAGCARKQEIFLEYLSSIQINNTNHLMEKRFDCILKDGEKIFRDKIIEFVKGLPKEAIETKAFTKFQEFLVQIGYDYKTYYYLEQLNESYKSVKYQKK